MIQILISRHNLSPVICIFTWLPIVINKRACVHLTEGHVGKSCTWEWKIFHISIDDLGFSEIDSATLTCSPIIIKVHANNYLLSKIEATITKDNLKCESLFHFGCNCSNLQYTTLYCLSNRKIPSEVLILWLIEVLIICLSLCKESVRRVLKGRFCIRWVVYICKA